LKPDAVHRALERGRQARASGAERAVIDRRLERLTPREREVLGLLVTGLPNKQMGVKLGVSEKTVKVHRARVMEKMEAGSLPELVRMVEKVPEPPRLR